MVPLSFGCGSVVFAAIATLAPSRAARSAIARPMPRLAPEMNSVLPLSDVIPILPLWSTPAAVACAAFEAYSHINRNGEVILPALLPARLRAAGSRIGRTESSLRHHRNRVG